MKDEPQKNKTDIQRIASCSGFSYIEVLIAIVIVATSLVPLMEAMQSAVFGASVYETSVIDVLALEAKAEEVLKKPFTDLENAATAAGSPTTPTSYSDSSPITTTDGRQITRNVYLWPYDADNADGDDDPFTGTDDGLLYEKVEIDGTSFFIETLTSE